MSATACNSFKFEPLILGVDLVGLRSPDGLALHYQDTSVSPTSTSPLLNMAAYGKGVGFSQPFQEAYPHYAYAEPQRSTYVEPHAQINNASFSANNTIDGQARQFTPRHSLLSYAPDSGPSGTRVHLKLATTSNLSNCVATVLFGAVPSQVDVQQLACPSPGNGESQYIFALTCEAPELSEAGCDASTVPVVLVVDENSDNRGKIGEELFRLRFGEFDYTHDGASSGASGSPPMASGELKQEYREEFQPRHDFQSRPEFQRQDFARQDFQRQDFQRPDFKRPDFQRPDFLRTEYHQPRPEYPRRHDGPDSHSQSIGLALAAVAAAGQAEMRKETLPALSGLTSSVQHQNPHHSLPHPHHQQPLPHEGQYEYPPPNNSPHSSSPYTSQFPSMPYRGPYDGYDRTPASSASGPTLLPALPAPLPRPNGGWALCQPLDGVRTPPLSHTSISRPGLSPQTSPSLQAPALVRTSTIPGSVTMNSGGPYGSYGSFQNRAELKLNGKLDSMATNWTPEERDNRRRIVHFSKQQRNAVITASFRPVSVSERPSNATCVSCIWWEERNECYITSVDTISLLEALVVAPNKFTVEEKNRIRRNLEGFAPITVSKSKPDSESFFRVIMNFSHPRPRNIEKDVKVYTWKSLAPALIKIIGKYSTSPMHSHSLPPPSAFHHGPQQPLPPLLGGPGYAYNNLDPSSPQPLASPRTLASAWAPFTTTVPPASTFQTPTEAQGLRQPVSSLSPPKAANQPPPPPTTAAPDVRATAPPLLKVSTTPTTTGLPNIGYVHGLAAMPGLSQSTTTTPSSAGSRWIEFGYPSQPQGQYFEGRM